MMHDTLKEMVARLAVGDPEYPLSRVLGHIDAITEAVEGLTLYDENARTMADAAESMRNRAVAILRGEQ